MELYTLAKSVPEALRARRSDHLAELLAVAVLGMFAYGVFSANLDTRLDSMNLSREVRSEMEAAKANLGAAEAPEGVDSGTAADIERAVEVAFVAAFRAVMVVSAGLALASALVAAVLVGNRRVRSVSRTSNLSEISIHRTVVGRAAPVRVLRSERM